MNPPSTMNVWPVMKARPDEQLAGADPLVAPAA
jgi:hypothetical protein